MSYNSSSSVVTMVTMKGHKVTIIIIGDKLLGAIRQAPKGTKTKKILSYLTDNIKLDGILPKIK